MSLLWRSKLTSQQTRRAFITRPPPFVLHLVPIPLLRLALVSFSGSAQLLCSPGLVFWHGVAYISLQLNKFCYISVTHRRRAERMAKRVSGPRPARRGTPPSRAPLLLLAASLQSIISRKGVINDLSEITQIFGFLKSEAT